jgi:hypothetical protein
MGRNPPRLPRRLAQPEITRSAPAHLMPIQTASLKFLLQPANPRRQFHCRKLQAIVHPPARRSSIATRQRCDK